MTVLSEKEEALASAIVKVAFAVHRAMGPGLLESIYEACFCYELKKHGIPHRRQAAVPLTYDGEPLSQVLRLDILVDDLIVYELKSIESMIAVFLAQILSQLKLSGKHLGFLINFNVALIKHGIRRVII